jgi:hypothetical protein
MMMPQWNEQQIELDHEEEAFIEQNGLPVTRGMKNKNTYILFNRKIASQKSFLKEMDLPRRALAPPPHAYNFSEESLSGQWINDSERDTCATCHSPFNLIVRRHHCRVCGDIFCGDCSTTRMVLSASSSLSLGLLTRPQRVCDQCAVLASLPSKEEQQKQKKKRQNSESVTSEEEEEDKGEDARKREQQIEQRQIIHTHSFAFAQAQTNSKHSISYRIFRHPVIFFTSALWYAKKEVSIQNPAIWILFVAISLSLYDFFFRIHPTLRKESNNDKNWKTKNKEIRLSKINRSKPSSTVAEAKAKAKAQCEPQHSSTLPEDIRNQLLNIGDRTMTELWHLVMEVPSETWELEADHSADENFKIFSRVQMGSKSHRMYLLDCTCIDATPSQVFEAIFLQTDRITKWNTNLSNVDILENLDPFTRIVRNVTKSLGGGIISAREFITLEKWKLYPKKDPKGYIIARNHAPVLDEFYPFMKNIVRGKDGLGGIVILPIEESTNTNINTDTHTNQTINSTKTHLKLLINVDIKGFFPTVFVRKGTVVELCHYIRHFTKHLTVEHNLQQ